MFSRSNRKWLCSIALSLTSIEASGGETDQSILINESLKLAIHVSEKVPRCMVALNEDLEFFQRLVGQGGLASSLKLSKQIWSESWPAEHHQESCAWTTRTHGADIYLSRSLCTSNKVEDLAEMFIHEAFHHLGIADEFEATENARKVMSAAESGKCGKILGDNVESQSEASGNYVALAIDPKTLSFGFVVDGETEFEAKSLSKKYCASQDCAVVDFGHNTCIASKVRISKNNLAISNSNELYDLKKMTLGEFVARFVRNDDFRPDNDMTIGLCSPSAYRYTTLHGPSSVASIEPKETFSAVARSKHFEVLVATSSHRTRFEAEEKALKDCNIKRGNEADCVIVGSFRGLTYLAEVVEASRCGVLEHDCPASNQVKFLRFYGKEFPVLFNLMNFNTESAYPPVNVKIDQNPWR